MSSIRIRRGTSDDMPFFRRMDLATTWENLTSQDRESVSFEDVARELEATQDMLLSREGNALFIAESEDGEPVGLLWYGENRNLISGETEGWVYNVSVVEAYRGRGVGALLIARAEEETRKRGLRSFGLMVAAHNDAARRLYGKLGLETTNHIMRRRLPRDEG